LTPSHPDRQRQHEEPHIRHIDVQALDALLRIEELLQKLIEVMASVPSVTVAETPVEEKPAAKTTARKNPRQL
jgi:hypothetical protein